MKNTILLLFFALFFALNLSAQRGYGFPAQDLRNPPDTGMVMITKRWPATSAGTNAAFWEYWSLTPAGGGGVSQDLQGIRDSILFLYGDAPEPDTAEQVVYKPGHGFDPSLCPGGILPLTENFDAATAANAEDLPFTYAIGTRGPDSLVIKSSGFYTSTAHGLTVGQVYYQQNDPCDLGLSPGTISAPVLLVIDANTIQLIDRSGTPGSDAVRIWIPSSQFTSRGDDPAAPLDSTVGAIALQYQSVGLARPGAIFVYQLPAGTNNPTYTAASGLSSFPARAWFWDGTRATRITNAGIAVDMQADSVGYRALVPATSGSAAEAIAFLDNNYGALPMPNGTYLYWKGGGTDTNPDTAYVVLDNPTVAGGQRVMLVKSRIAMPNTIYTGDGSYTGNRRVTSSGGDYLEVYGTKNFGNFEFKVTNKPTVVGSAQVTIEGSNSRVIINDSQVSKTQLTNSDVSQYNIISGSASSTNANNFMRVSVANNTSQANFTVEENAANFSSTTATPGITYVADYSANYTVRSLTDKNYVDTRLGGRTLLNTTAPTAGQTYLWDVADNRFEIGTPGGASPTDLSFTGSASPVTLNSSTGTDVTLTAGTNTTFSQTANNLTINAAGTNLGFSITGGGTGARITSSTGSLLDIEDNGNIAFADLGGVLGISATGDGNGIYGGSGTVPNGTGATLLGTFSIVNAGGAGLYLNQGTNTHFLGQTAGTRFLVAPTLNQVELYGDGTNAADMYFYDADASAAVLVRADDVVNGGGYVVEWPATGPAVGEQLVYTGSNTYDWAQKSKIVRFMPAADTIPLSTTFPTYQVIDNFLSTQNTPDWTVASAISFLYSGTTTKTFVLRFTASGETASGLPVEFSYEINTAGKVVIATELSAEFSVAGQAFVTMNSGDTLRFYVRPTSGTLTGVINNVSGSLEEF